jgi:hypothetical protein
MAERLVEALRLAGFALAHAAWSIEGGQTLCTLAFVDVDTDDKQLIRYEAETIPDSIEGAHSDLAERLRDGGIAALVFDGFLTPEGGERSDALCVEVFGPRAQPLGLFFQPYRAAKRPRIQLPGRSSRFAITGEPFVDDSIKISRAEQIILEGAREHPHGARLFGLH